ncbi:MAG: carbon storage regulator [Planctomycetes bacterium GWF2_42_9]|nr:MAG: carbon storage regulator [Planctomycetes bacterium GWF2_42_9]
MLVLTRKANESIRIGNDIEIEVVRIQGNQIRLGITAPKGIPIVRDDCKKNIPNAETKNSSITSCR